MMVLSPKSKNNLWRCGEVSVAAAVITTVWILYSIPSVVKFGPRYMDSDSGHKEVDESGVCTRQVYDGVCKQHLAVYHPCIFNSSPGNQTNGDEVYIPASTAALEDTARIIVPSLAFLNPSPECEAELAPFICLNIFGLCAGNGEILRPSSSQCDRIGSDVCTAERMTALELIAAFEGQAGSLDVKTVFPDCLTLPNETSCDITFNSNTTSQSSNTATISNDSTSTFAVRKCSPDFFFNSFNICMPQCGQWEQYSHTTAVAAKAIVILSSVIFLIATSVVLVLSLIQHERMMRVPSVFLIYQLLSGSAIPLVWLIGYSSPEQLYCSNRSYADSVRNPTNFCYFTGTVEYFIPLHTTCLWLCHILVVLSGVLCPFRVRALLTNPKSSRCLHALLLLVCFIPPAVLTGGTFAYGDYITQFPPVFCASENPSSTYYLLNLPLTILCATGASSLIIILILLIRRRRTKQRSYIEAELKLLVSFFYYIILTLVAIIGFTLILRNADNLEEELFEYFFCESMGNIGESTCSRSGFESVDHTSITLPCVAIVLAIYPLVILTYVVNIKEIREHFSALAKRISLAKMKKKVKSSNNHTVLQDNAITVNANSYASEPNGFESNYIQFERPRNEEQSISVYS